MSSYLRQTIAETVARINNQYYLPAIQREFVWKPDQIIVLFDSILRGYPISSCLFWEVQEKNRDNWKVYKFIDDAKEGGVHNTQASTDGVRQMTLVLDGQQRLTSLRIGLKGSYTIKKKYARRNNPNAWERQCLYLDLMQDPEQIQDDEPEDVYYGLKFAPSQPVNDAKQHWFKVGQILDYDTEESFYAFRQTIKRGLPGQTTMAQADILERNLDTLYRAIWKHESINYYVERNQDYDRVLDIFVRANQGGTKLTKSDLLLSMVTSEWKGLNAREEIFNFVERLNTQLMRKNSFDKDFVMKTCLMLVDQPVKYKVENFTPKNLLLIQEKWESIKSALERTVDLTNYFGIDKENLTSANALIPIIYFLYSRPALTFRGITPYEVQNAAKIRCCLIACLLNNVFSGSTDTMLQSIREVLKNYKSESDPFPLLALNKAVSGKNRSSVFDERAIENVLEFTYGDQSFLALSVLFEDLGWGAITYHQDHIFPQDLLKTKHLEKAGVQGDRITECQELKDRLGNLTLLISTENIQKSNQPFEKWLLSRDPSFKQRHLIPADPKLYSLDKFPEFVSARESLIKSRLQTLVPHKD